MTTTQLTRTNTMAILAATAMMIMTVVCVNNVNAADFNGGVSLSIPLTMNNFGSGMILTVHGGASSSGGVDVLNLIDNAVVAGDTVTNVTNNNGKGHKPKKDKKPKKH